MERLYLFTVVILLTAISCHPVNDKKEVVKIPERIQGIIDQTKLLENSRGGRLPLYLWPAIDPGACSDMEAKVIVDTLNGRGIGVVSSWKPNMDEKSIQQVLTIAKAQKKLGLRININANSLLYGFYNGDEEQAHIDKDGHPFFDESFESVKNMGCPFTLDARKKVIRDRVESFSKRYKAENLPVDFVFADWEIDGPMEVNNTFESSKECVRCQEFLGKDFGFDTFQKSMREMRSYLQNYAFSAPVQSCFPNALVGNYAIYPADGYRYWYDYFEFLNEKQPYKKDQKATYRKWYNDFPLTGYTCAMPVVYPWSSIYSWYDFKNDDYRWFYNMLLVASNVGKSTPSNIPIVSFVHWHTVYVGTKTDEDIPQMSKTAYQELLWHMLLRGTDTFFMWCPRDQEKEETQLVQEVYADAQKYGKFLEHGVPFTFDVPDHPGAVISGLALNDSVLVRRTDFDENHEPVSILVGTKRITVNYAPAACKVLSLN